MKCVLTHRWTLAASALFFSGTLLCLPAGSAYAQGKPAPGKPTASPQKPKPNSPGTRNTSPTEKPGKPDKTAKLEKPAKKDDTVAFFRDGVVPRLKIQISEPELQLLRQQNREYVRCTVVEEGGKEYEHVGIHLKGAAGSFRGIDDKPALTLNFDKFKDGQDFHDLDKIHLNNSVQDPSYLNELICSELFLAAGVPAARTTHARVWLNGRDLGFYVLKEGFDKHFVKRHFPDASGNLYEGGFVQDINGQVKLQSGEGVTDRSDVKAVVDACREPDLAKRWGRLDQVVDIDRFLSFMAMELLTCHWDGYCNNRNNYRFYFEPKSGKVHFFPHGMDQMFGDPGAGVLHVPGAMLANAVMGNPEWKARYQERAKELAKLLVPPDRLQARVDELHQRLRPVLMEMNPGHANAFDGQVRACKDRLAARARSLTQQLALAQPPPMPPVAVMPGSPPKPTPLPALTAWEPRMETADARLEPLEEGTGKTKVRTLTITAGPSGRCVASWRMSANLPAGRYRLEGRARAEGVKALTEASGTGAGIRISGSSRTNKLEGTTGWTPLAHEFQVGAPTQDVVLVAELRASAGKVVFDAGSLRLVRLGD